MGARARLRKLVQIVCLGIAAACSNELVVEPVGTIVNAWTVLPPPSEEALPGLDEVALFERVSNRLEERFVLPRELRVVHLGCGAENAFYDPPETRIRMCDELLAKVIAVTRADPELTEEDVLAHVHSTWVLMFLHEVGHAFIDIYNLPVLGREEYAVDDFAALLLINAGEASMAKLAFDYYAALSKSRDASTDFADEHGLDLQRYYYGLCVVYGSDPTLHADIVEQGILSEEQAAHCPSQYRELLRDWKAVLGDRLKDAPPQR